MLQRFKICLISYYTLYYILYAMLLSSSLLSSMGVCCQPASRREVICGAARESAESVQYREKTAGRIKRREDPSLDPKDFRLEIGKALGTK